MKKIEIGELRERVTIQTPGAPVDDGGGGTTTFWTDLAEVWAAVRPVSNAERYYAQQVEASTTHEIFIRWRGDVKNNMRVLHRGAVYDVTSVADVDGRRRFLKLMCEEESFA
jgi:SPP1 family predicted phage head-tail adaptor